MQRDTSVNDSDGNAAPLGPFEAASAEVKIEEDSAGRPVTHEPRAQSSDHIGGASFPPTHGQVPGYSRDLNSPIYQPVSPISRPNTPIYQPTSPMYLPDSTIFNPNSPIYIPASPMYQADSPIFSPNTPIHEPASPRYQPDSPIFSPNSPVYQPASPKYHSPMFSPNSPKYQPVSPMFEPCSPPGPCSSAPAHAPASPTFNFLSPTFPPANPDHTTDCSDLLSSHSKTPTRPPVCTTPRPPVVSTEPDTLHPVPKIPDLPLEENELPRSRSPISIERMDDIPASAHSESASSNESRSPDTECEHGWV